MAARIASALFLAGALVLMTAARSEALLIVYVCDDPVCAGGPNFTINDGGLGDSDTDAGQVSIQVAGFSGSITANSKAAIGSATAPALNITYTLGPAAFLAFPTPFVFAADDGFTAAGVATFQANATFLSGGGASLFSGPGTFVPSPPIGISNCLSVALGGCTLTTPVGSASYYLALRVGPSPNFQGQASGDASVTVASVPDGGSAAALLGSVLVGFGMVRRRFSNS